MTERQLTLEVKNSSGLLDAMRGLGAASSDTSDTVSGALRAMHLAVHDKNIITSSPEDNKLGLTASQARPLFVAATSLLENVTHGLTPQLSLSPEDIGRERRRPATPDYATFDNALVEAKRLGLPPIKVELNFDDVAYTGTLEVSHPIVPGITTEFNLEAAIKIRQDEHVTGIRLGGHGGIHTINELVAEVLEIEGLHMDSLQTTDKSISPLEPDRGGIRRMWINFKRSGA